MTNEEENKSAVVPVICALMTLGVIISQIILFTTRPKDDTTMVYQNTTYDCHYDTDKLKTPECLAERISDLEDEVSALKSGSDLIIAQLPLKERCRVERDFKDKTSDKNQYIFIVPVWSDEKECAPYLEKVQEHYLIP